MVFTVFGDRHFVRTFTSNSNFLSFEDQSHLLDCEVRATILQVSALISLDHANRKNLLKSLLESDRTLVGVVETRKCLQFALLNPEIFRGWILAPSVADEAARLPGEKYVSELLDAERIDATELRQSNTQLICVWLRKMATRAKSFREKLPRFSFQSDLILFIDHALRKIRSIWISKVRYSYSGGSHVTYALSSLFHGRTHHSNRFSPYLFDNYPSISYYVGGHCGADRRNPLANWLRSLATEVDQTVLKERLDVFNALDGIVKFICRIEPLAKTKQENKTRRGNLSVISREDKETQISVNRILSGSARNKPSVSVIVPVCNNGLYLLGVCLPSLVSQKSWESMEVVVVDDGSDDVQTLEILSFIESQFANCRVIRLSGPPSGSASRPRNVGIQQSNAPLVTFLDPDNAIADFGYDRLLRIHQMYSRRGFDPEFISGVQIKIGSFIGETGRNCLIGDRIVTEPKKHFFAKGFPTVSTQAALIDRDLIQRCELEFVEGAVGQDTLFGWQTIIASRFSVLVGDVYLLYFATRSGSVTNNKTLEYLRRVYQNEVRQREFLDEAHLLPLYRRYRMEGSRRARAESIPEGLKDSDLKEFHLILEAIENLYSSG